MTDFKEKVTEAAGERRHEPRRMEDQADGRSKRRHFLIVAVSRHPVLIAFGVATLIAMIPVLMLLDQQAKIRDQQGQIKTLYQQLQLSRRATSTQFCESINKSALANNRTTDVITQFVIESTRSSRAFENVYRQLGLPPYKERIKQSKKLADDLVRQKVPVIDCKGIARQIDAQLAAAGRPNQGAKKDGRLDRYPDSHGGPNP